MLNMSDNEEPEHGESLRQERCIYLWPFITSEQIFYKQQICTSIIQNERLHMAHSFGYVGEISLPMLTSKPSV